MRIHFFLLLALIAKTLATLRYRRDSGVSFSEGASVSAGSNGIGAGYNKSIGLKTPNLFGLGGKSESKEIDLNFGGGIGLKSNWSLDRRDKDVGISFGGSGGWGIGISDSDDKRYSKKGYSKKHDTSKKHKSLEESSKELGVGLGVGGGAGLSFGSKGISIGGGILTGIKGTEHGGGYGEGHSGHNSHEAHHSSGSKGSINWSNEHSDEGGIIVKPIFDGEKSGGDVSWQHSSGSKFHEHQNQDGEKGESGNHHVEGSGSIISHGSGGQSSGHKEHNNENSNGNSHVKGEGGIIISHEDHYSSHSESKGHQGSSKENETRKGGKGSDGYVEDGKNSTVSHNNSGKSDNDDKKYNNGDKNHGKGESVHHGSDNGNGVNVIISGGHGGSKNFTGHGSGKESGGKNNGYLGNCSGSLGNRKCGSDIKGALEFVQTFIRVCDVIVRYLMQSKQNELRGVLCLILPYKSKLSCQLGCNIPRPRPILFPHRGIFV